MRTRSSSNLPVESPPNPLTSNPKRHNRRRSKQPFILEESPVDTMADQRTMAELLRAPTEGYAEAILVPWILAEQFELKHSLINMMTSDQFFGIEKDNPHDHIRWFKKITSTIKYKDVPNFTIKLMFFPFSLTRAARRWLEKEPSRSILTWEDLVSKFINEFFPPSRTTNLHNEISNFQQRFDESFHEAWDRYKDLLLVCPRHGFTELHQLDTFYNALNPADQDSFNSAAGGNLLERRTQDMLIVIENKSKVPILKQFQATLPPAFVKAVEEIYVTCGGAHTYYQCLAAGGNTFPELRDNIQGYVATAAVNYNQGSGSLPSNTVANPKGELNAITTRSGIVLDGPSVPILPLFINPEEGQHVEETLTDQDLAEYTIKVPPPLVKKSKPPSQKTLLCIKGILFTPISLTLQGCSSKSSKKKMKSKSTNSVILKKLLEKLGDPGKFLIPCGFSELKCKALADLGDSINLMPLSVWKKLGLPELISTCMTLELANRAICTPAGIARDVLVPVGKFTFPVDFIIVDYESDPRVLLILGRPFLWTARTLIDVHGEEMIFRDGDERLTLNMRHDTSSYSRQPQKESINLINVFNDSSEDFLEKLFLTNHQSGNPTFSSHPNLTSSEVKDDIFDLEGGNILPEKFLDLKSTRDLYPTLNINPLSGSTTSSSPSHLLEEFADEFALITFPPRNDDLPFDIKSDLKKIEYLLYHEPIKDIDSILKDSIDQSDLTDLNDNLANDMPEMFTDEHALDYSSPPVYDEYDDDLFEVESDTEYVYDDPFDSKGEKIKESKLLIDELDLPSDFLPPSKYESCLSKDFSKVNALPSTNNEDKVFNPEVPRSKILLSFLSENEGKVFKPGILTSEEVHSSLIPELSHQGYKVFKINQILKGPMNIFLFFYRENILDVPYL
nr:reverse transcriptase domain-containing protein [Tanacetum cinerariifolium]